MIVYDLIKRTAKMISETKKFEYVIRLFEYLTILLLGISYGKLTDKKSENKIIQRQQKNEKTGKKNKNKKVSTSNTIIDSNVKPTTSQNNVIDKLNKLKTKLSFVRKLLRWNHIFEQIVVLKQFIMILDTDNLTTNQMMALLNTTLYLLFLFLDQIVLYFIIQENQTKKNVYNGRSIKYGRIPVHFTGTVKYLLLLNSIDGNNVELYIGTIVLLMQNGIDLVMYLATYYLTSWYKMIGSLGVIGSIIAIVKYF